MFLQRTVFQLVTGPRTPDLAAELGRFAFIQWLGGLPGDAGYRNEALRAHAMAAPFREISPSVAVFCELLAASLQMPPRPLALASPTRKRRGGARARRAG